MIRTVKQRKPLEPICSIVYVEISAWPGFRISTAYSVSGPTTVLIQKIMAFPRMLKSSTVRLHHWTGESDKSSAEQSNNKIRFLGSLGPFSVELLTIASSRRVFSSCCTSLVALVWKQWPKLFNRNPGRKESYCKRADKQDALVVGDSEQWDGRCKGVFRWAGGEILDIAMWGRVSENWNCYWLTYWLTAWVKGAIGLGWGELWPNTA